ncbi:TPA: substrate-binding domain-containing protein [Klebsiella pneumoniae]|nr:substrate-binding domain-containing protein [Klebsiella pneumoniae]
MKSKSATLEDVARHAGVSYQTVSRVLNKSANVSEATRRKVEKSIEALRYVPNRLAQQLVGNDQMALGVLSAFHQHQVAVPGEKSVIGYDDTYESSFFYPALSTVSLDLDLQGKEAVRRILASTSGAPHTSSILPARLVIRHSSGARIEQGKDLQAIAEQLRAIAHRLAP